MPGSFWLVSKLFDVMLPVILKRQLFYVEFNPFCWFVHADGVHGGQSCVIYKFKQRSHPL